MTLRATRVCSWRLVRRSEVCCSSRKAATREWMRAHTSGKDGGGGGVDEEIGAPFWSRVSWTTRGEAGTSTSRAEGSPAVMARHGILECAAWAWETCRVGAGARWDEAAARLAEEQQVERRVAGGRRVGASGTRTSHVASLCGGTPPSLCADKGGGVRPVVVLSQVPR